MWTLWDRNAGGSGARGVIIAQTVVVWCPPQTPHSNTNANGPNAAWPPITRVAGLEQQTPLMAKIAARPAGWAHRDPPAGLVCGYVRSLPQSERCPSAS